MVRVLVAMSGGVDSSVSALLLRQAGHDVVGVFMRNGVSAADASPAPVPAAPASRSCCSAADARDAAAVAARLGVAFYAVDYAQEFAALMDRFAEEYRRGRTPSPCVLCNQHLKFGHLFELGDAVGADFVATGHYARAENGRLLRAADRAKDQSYYLFGVDRQRLPRVLFPLGGMSKAEVRAKAREAGLVTADKAESMEICFVTSGDYRDVVRARGGAGRAGRFVAEDGRELGAHDGVDAFTVGQRRGLPALGVPHYVKAIDAATGDVVLARREGLLASEASVRGVRWLGDAPGADGHTALVQVRARSAPAVARLLPSRDGDAVHVRFAEPQQAVTPGQAAVFYDGDLVLGGGWLD